MLYTILRENAKAGATLIDLKRKSLKDPPQTQVGPGKGRLVDVGPLILGHRLETSKTYGAYTTLVYNKGAMVLRMIHFLMSNPADGNDKAFYDMMKDFVEKYRNNVASTEDFRRVAGEHFAKTVIARKYQLNNLDWFFQQWVYESSLPSYRLEYQVQSQDDGTAMVSGTAYQENAAGAVVYAVAGRIQIREQQLCLWNCCRPRTENAVHDQAPRQTTEHGTRPAEMGVVGKNDNEIVRKITTVKINRRPSAEMDVQPVLPFLFGLA